MHSIKFLDKNLKANEKIVSPNDPNGVNPQVKQLTSFLEKVEPQ
jgi:hypothetical protein